MDVRKLERQTLSEAIVIDGEYKTRRGNTGFVIGRGDESFVQELYDTGAADGILGELVVRIYGDGDTSLDGERQLLGLPMQKITKVEAVEDPGSPGNMINVSRIMSRAELGYARFVVVKGYSALPKCLAVRRSGLINYIIKHMLCPEPTEASLISDAVALDMSTTKGDYDLSGKSMLLVVDKVYVRDAGRKCGISEYIHNNLVDIVHTYTAVRPKLVVLNCGDFTSEHRRQGITEEEYKNRLKKHYTKCGYKVVPNNSTVSQYVMWKELKESRY